MMQWAAAARAATASIIVNKIDAEGVDLPALVAQIQAAFGKRMPAAEPAGRTAARGRRLLLQPAAPAATADFSSVEQAHRALVEQVVEVDAGLRRALPQRRRRRPERAACAARTGAARRPPDPDLLRLGAQRRRRAELLDVIVRLLPNPTEGNPPQFLKGERKAGDGDRPPSPFIGLMRRNMAMKMTAITAAAMPRIAGSTWGSEPNTRNTATRSAG